ncbi:molybdopterin-binding protein [Natrinema thermotolerans]|uniref:Molybdopterin-binding protein n=1 Tax=Natrinema thermotolerans TaxID=121872 RepID=A0AAF0PE51_9EURY|nr:molybdopterin-binding protein [Natrinema thermotolerans]QCC58371.1 molybdenum cofactor biosynthesis protein [Natrinema thermotolerans]WMT09490.1 molybdopterin-binding protein [Natrinema thermotolerans]
MDETDADTLCTGVITIASDRGLEEDAAGETVTDLLEADGHEVAVREHVNSDHDTVQSIVSRLLDRDDVDIVITAGATGVEPGDITIEAVEPLLKKELAAFSELVTVLGYERVGTAVVGARTLAGVADGTPVFCLPGHVDAVQLALEEIVLAEASTLVERAGYEAADADEESSDADEEPTDANGAEPADGGA